MEELVFLVDFFKPIQDLIVVVVVVVEYLSLIRE